MDLIAAATHHCRMTRPGVYLYWVPVGAGTSELQRASLRLWEAIEAARARRPRMILLHSALKLVFEGGETSTLELTPEFIRAPVPALAGGPVGSRLAGRLRLFRYQLLCLPVTALPDEEWAIASPVVLSEDARAATRILELAPTIPRHTWGRRAPGTREMWTSDSVVSWLLVRAGIDLSGVAPPAGGRAPGWYAGLDLARERGTMGHPGP